jgi:hypothetical protein
MVNAPLLVSLQPGYVVLVTRNRYSVPGGVLRGTVSEYEPDPAEPMGTEGIVPMTVEPQSASIFTAGPGLPV